VTRLRRIATNSIILSVFKGPLTRARYPALDESQADDKAALALPQEGQLDVVCKLLPDLGSVKSHRHLW
jgi:hypothetical protein